MILRIKLLEHKFITNGGRDLANLKSSTLFKSKDLHGIFYQQTDLSAGLNVVMDRGNKYHHLQLSALAHRFAMSVTRSGKGPIRKQHFRDMKKESKKLRYQPIKLLRFKQSDFPMI